MSIEDMDKLKCLLENLELTQEERSALSRGDNEPPETFKRIAAAMLGGHFVVASHDDRVIVTPTCVEIYYHEEFSDGIKDFIVYHRNTKQNKKQAFPFGILHNHVSGIDITFEKGESEDRAIRASALIREFKIENGQDLTKIELKEYETRSTYIYAALFSQFSIFDGFTVKWVDGEGIALCDVICSPRKNVKLYDADGKKTDKADERKWQFKVRTA